MDCGLETFSTSTLGGSACSLPSLAYGRLGGIRTITARSEVKPTFSWPQRWTGLLRQPRRRPLQYMYA